MKQKRESSSREVGLKIGWICGEYFLKLEHLHYGYWTGELKVDITNLRSAQEEYVQFLLSHIPEGVKTILDVGCGAGRVAKRMLSMGYAVDCVSPSVFLTEQTRNSVGEQCEIFECGYEELETGKRYDLIMFVESFQYIDLPQALANTVKFLNAGGTLLICDIFKKAAEEKSRQSGGHDLNKFFALVETYPFTLVEDIDVTDQTAPNIDLLNEALEKVAKPVADSVADFLADRYPTVFKLLSWKYQEELEKINRKYSGGSRTAEHFKQFKSYRLLRYRKNQS
jgi:2-polyprenyl-3-methyl-5-hydroxy-6-metoxy-1,4-benzoquinol methylase